MPARDAGPGSAPGPRWARWGGSPAAASWARCPHRGRRRGVPHRGRGGVAPRRGKVAERAPCEKPSPSPRGSQRTSRKKLRISATHTSGSSIAAKWPPRVGSFQ
ncbi:hypothetical protein GCM10017786_26530 [Amycolatopsis deserti]|uniref:Uncharacterized protein n=1 Tax=Amycolatopsis deserti TaxID=185696 RepID=A0ABQ3ISY8_9PSEU|nr:hypothetical protein GCM10017786_26530 [Amycolatopsis deserti]